MIKEARLRLGLSQEELAKKTKIKLSHIIKLENGEGKLETTVSQSRALIETLQIDINEIALWFFNKHPDYNDSNNK